MRYVLGRGASVAACEDWRQPTSFVIVSARPMPPKEWGMPMLQVLSLHARKTLCCLLQLLALTAFANAQAPARVVQDFGLLGAWAGKCDQSPGPLNEHAVFSLTAAGNIQLLNDFGPDYDDMVYRVIAAERLASNRISLRQALTTDAKVVLDVVIVRDNDKIRIWSSRTADGTTLVRDGTIALTNGHATQWVGHCTDRWAVKPISDTN